jgi:2,5-diamino-6-(ribosylamino)-4(3H)-pyrimidinone 5'-phosphate reductase
MRDRPFTTLFLLQSLDGKISTGDTDVLDVDKDFPKITSIKEGLHQYYAIEKTTDTFSLNTGRVMAKIGINRRINEPQKINVNFIIIDNKPHLNAKGIKYLSKWVKTLFLVTTNKNHPAFRSKHQNIKIIKYSKKINLSDLLNKMKRLYGTKRITIQSGGTLNSAWLRQGLIDNVSIVIAPCLIGGRNTQSLIGGESLHTPGELRNIKALKLIKANVLKNSYLHLKYKVLNKTVIK